MKPLGHGYVQGVEYLENHLGAEWINTGIYYTPRISMGLTIAPITASSTACICCGTRKGCRYSYNFANSEVYGLDQIFDYESPSAMYASYHAHLGGTAAEPFDRTFHTIELFSNTTENATYIGYDGNYRKILDELGTTRSSTMPAGVFHVPEDARKMSCRISEFWLRDMDEYLIYLKAGRVYDEGVMYDLVSGRIFHNAGTGSFTCGPDTGKLL